MHFNSLVYPVFLGAILLLYHGLPWRIARFVLLAASYLFYSAAHPWYCGLLVTSTIVDFVVARKIAAQQQPRRKTLLLLVSVSVNLGLLGVFKYGSFLVGNVNSFADWLRVSPLPEWEFLLPVGISFYTFQTLAYTIDVYRGNCKPERDLVTFALFVSFFPQLVAGPIERARDLIPQLAQKVRPTQQDIEFGFQRILWGFVKKLVISDRIALMVNEVYADPSAFSSPVLATATLGFTVQLYLDFSAYCDIAIGSARLLGVRLSENFHWPLMARNPSDFWNRWHSTLTFWFRDYVFQPLGGMMRKHPARTFANVLLVMTLIGAWHGAGWNYILFGLLHGLCLAVYQVLRLRPGRRTRGPLFGASWWAMPLAIVIWQFFVNAWAVIFRSPTPQAALAVYQGILSGPFAWDHRYDIQLIMVALFYAYHACGALFLAERAELKLPAPVRGAFWFALVVLLVYGTLDGTEQFIYFQF